MNTHTILRIIHTHSKMLTQSPKHCFMLRLSIDLKALNHEQSTVKNTAK